MGTAGATPGSIVYGSLPNPVTLNAYATYYILSQETQNGDSWYDLNTSAQTRGDASLEWASRQCFSLCDHGGAHRPHVCASRFQVHTLQRAGWPPRLW